MKNRRSFLLALTVLLLAPLPLMAQAGQGRQGAGGRGMGEMMGARTLLQHGSVEYLVTKATDLQLTTEQTGKLTSIGSAYAVATKESRERIAAALPARQGGAQARDAGAGAGVDRQAMSARMQELRPLLTALQEADQKSLAEALALLTDGQKEKAKVLLAEREPARPRRS